MTLCVDCHSYHAMKTLDTDPYGYGPPRLRFKAVCGFCWTKRDATQPLRKYPLFRSVPEWREAD